MSDATFSIDRDRRTAAASRAAAGLVRSVLGDDPPIHLTLPDGTTVGPPDAALRVRVRDLEAFAHLVRAPGELGLARAYVSGAVDVDGDVSVAVAVRDHVREASLWNRDIARLVAALGPDLVRNPPPVPPEEIQGHRNPLTRHSKRRDKASISHHYDVSNDFYRLVLGPSMTYSCAAFGNDTDSLEQAQQNKVELVCRKLGLAPGLRLLDVGCGWGAMVMHAARHFGVRAVGVTISEQQHAHAREAVRAAGLEHLVEIRLQDYRDIDDGPYDAISSIGMFEHVGLARTAEYFGRLRALLRPEGRLLNHQIGRPPSGNTRFGKERTAVDPNGFIHRYVFPDGELLEVGTLVHAMQEAGFEVRHLESLREHYARTLEAWGANLDARWADAVSIVGEGRARVWKLYMAASAVMFRTNRLQVHQVLGVNTPASGRSAMPWRPAWDADLAHPGGGPDGATASPARSRVHGGV
jgi:cyclopropane-fatty-acyl-phospholipid synthase